MQIEVISGVIPIDRSLKETLRLPPGPKIPGTNLMNARCQFCNDLILKEFSDDKHLHPMGNHFLHDDTWMASFVVAQNACADSMSHGTYDPMWSLLNILPYKFLAKVRTDGKVQTMINRDGVRVFKVEVVFQKDDPDVIQMCNYVGISEPFEEKYKGDTNHNPTPSTIRRDFERVTVLEGVTGDLMWSQGPQAMTFMAEIQEEVQAVLEKDGFVIINDGSLADIIRDSRTPHEPPDPEVGDGIVPVVRGEVPSELPLNDEDGNAPPAVSGDFQVFRVEIPESSLVEEDIFEDPDDEEWMDTEPSGSESLVPSFRPVLIKDALRFKIPSLEWINDILDGGKSGIPDSKIEGGIPKEVDVAWSAIVRGIQPSDIVDGKVVVHIAVHPVHEYGEDYGYYY